MTGILVVSFGTTYACTREKNIEQIVRDIKEKYKDIPVYQAYSSSIVRKVLEERDHVLVDDMEMALEKMHRDGIRKVYILPTHIIDGIENCRLKEAASHFFERFEYIKTARPLLGNESDYEKAADCLLSELVSEVREDTLLLMGHGSAHEADKSYQKLAERLRARRKNTYLATVEGAVGIQDVLKQMAQDGCKKGRVVVTPFMLVAGDHANHDMAGEEAGSFARLLEEQGFSPECLLKGIGEYKGIRRLYLEHLEELFESGCVSDSGRERE